MAGICHALKGSLDGENGEKAVGYPKDLTLANIRRKKSIKNKFVRQDHQRYRSKCLQGLNRWDFSKKRGHSCWPESQILSENLPFPPLSPPFLSFFLRCYYIERSHLYIFEGIISTAFSPATYTLRRPVKCRKTILLCPLPRGIFRKKRASIWRPQGNGLLPHFHTPFRLTVH